MGTVSLSREFKWCLVWQMVTYINRANWDAISDKRISLDKPFTVGTEVLASVYPTHKGMVARLTEQN